MKENSLAELTKILSENHPEYCHQCGKCTSGCPAARYTEFRPRDVVLMVQMGLTDELVNSELIWLCTECFTCLERCPREVTPYDVVRALRIEASRRGIPPPGGIKTLADKITKFGLIQEPQKVKMKTGERVDRQALGLPELQRPSDLSKLSDILGCITSGGAE